MFVVPPLGGIEAATKPQVPVRNRYYERRDYLNETRFAKNHSLPEAVIFPSVLALASDEPPLSVASAKTAGIAMAFLKKSQPRRVELRRTTLRVVSKQATINNGD